MVMAKHCLISPEFRKFTLFLLAVSPVIFYFLPSDKIYYGHSVCLFRNLFGIECYGCGMVRALYSAIHLNITESISYNPMVIIVAPLLFYVWSKTLYIGIKSRN